MKILSVDSIPIIPRLAARNTDQKVRFAGIDTQTIFRVKTDKGITGYGDCRGHAPLPQSTVASLVDHSPFDFIGADLPTGVVGALYDVMGKHLEVPAYKLMGQKLRDRVPVAAWTRPASPEDLAKEVQRAAAEGYRIFKMHTCEHHDVMAQNRAVEEVAPPGFRMHYDFNHNRPPAAVNRIIHALEPSPVVGFIEDPIFWQDLEGWRLLRQKTSFPLLMHVPQLGGGPELLGAVADLYMVGETGIARSLRLGFACALANVSTVIQMTGGTLCKAMALHLGAVLPNISHSINLDDQYDEDVTGGRIEVAEGSSPVPEKPGLGVEVNEEILARLASAPATVLPRHLGVLYLPGGRKFYAPSIPSVSRLTGFVEGNLPGLSSEVWTDDASPQFSSTFERVQREGAFME
jgi:L-alanine-DL-glutamate epimerase-like enolase superfamily enzyme